MVLFGHVDEVEVHGEGASDIAGQRQGKSGYGVADGRFPVVGWVLAALTTEQAKGFDRSEEIIAALLAQHVAEDASQEGDIARKRLMGASGGGGIRHAI